MFIENGKDINFAMKNFRQLKYKLIGKRSKAETHFEKLLSNSNLYYIREKCNFRLDTNWCYYDFYIPRLRMYIEIDGAEHNLPEQKIIDNEKEHYVNSKFCYLVRIKNEDALLMDRIDAYTLRNLYFEQYNKEDYGFRCYMKKRYYQTIENNGERQRSDIKKLYSKKDIYAEIYLYSHMTGNYHYFKNLFECCRDTGFKARYILDLLNTEYKKSSARLYVAGRTLSICEANVATVYN